MKNPRLHNPEGTPSYPYRSLSTNAQEIRLLNVRRGKGDDPLRCKISHAFLEDDPKYETISYVWGDASMLDTITLDGQEVSAPASSVAALRRMRLPDADRVLWVDAVCIDQSNVVERSHQVALMRGVYSKCFRNLIFLDGMDDLDSAAAAAKNIHAIWEHARKETDNFKTLSDAIYEAANIRDYLSVTPVEIDREALRTLYHNPWFKRLWVVQEAVLPPESLCHYGNEQISLLNLLIGRLWALWVFGVLKDEIGLDFRSFLNLLNMLKDRVNREGPVHRLLQRESVVKAIFIGRGMFCSDPRDHVFGVIGRMECARLTEHIPSTLRPDYQKSVLEVYRDATLLMWQDGDIPEVLDYHSHHSEDDLDSSVWPSWVPRWDRPFDFVQDPVEFKQVKIAYEVDSMSFGNSFVDNGANRLLCHGVRLDSIEERSSINRMPLPDDDDDNFNVEDCMFDQRWLDEAKVIAKERDQQLSYTLIAGTSCERTIATQADAAGLRDLHSYMAKWSRRPHRPCSDEECCTESARNAARYEFAWRLACQNRRLLATKDRTLALGPQLTRKSDILVLLRGSASPCILREVGDEYLLLGNCYVHELMHKEAFRGQVEAGKPMESFVIR